MPDNEEGSENGILTLVGTIVLGVILVAVLLFISLPVEAENALAESVVTEVPIKPADDATATAGTVILTDPTEPTEAVEVTETGTTFSGVIEDGSCWMAVTIGDFWNLEFVEEFRNEHNCTIEVTNSK